MKSIKPIETKYKGYRFRSRLEARWAVFFDAMGIKWEYEPIGFALSDGTLYLPDFYLHINRRMNEDEPERRKGCWVEVKGIMTEEDAHKIRLFSEELPIIVLGNIPSDVVEYITQGNEIEYGITYNNYETIDGDWYTAFFVDDVDGEPKIVGADHYGWDSGDSMNKALECARQAHFEHGENG